MGYKDERMDEETVWCPSCEGMAELEAERELLEREQWVSERGGWR